MKINRLDAHDRFSHFKKQNFDIGECVQDIINQQPFGVHPFYIFAHTRTDEDGVTKRLIWQPRLTKPKAEENSMLFRVSPNTDIVTVVWMIPARELWNNFKKGQMTQSEIICNSIHAFLNNRAELEAPDPEDLSEQEIHGVYCEISQQARVASRVKSMVNL
jgi:hypothetical protein